MKGSGAKRPTCAGETKWCHAVFKVHRVTPLSLALLGRVHPDCFDHPIRPELARACVESKDAMLIVAVDAELNGGTTRALLNRVLELGKAGGANLLWVGVGLDNEVAKSFYRSIDLVGADAENFERKLSSIFWRVLGTWGPEPCP